ncbi:Fur family transcriptional regulator, peroxide stress response regulator [Candidatus Hakubella thermalkaliphila]|uniref:Fur family transcriptional regulator, peroxide stress response regulator n=1 Tax=Candidatus Hakubella thermalkaliphila TaxID=2754717 RepID=A0A6V8NT02_9ACTN|nr:Fur family transcriptional regulator, peroxide stress response regulator [Candidatus Hakubella thermalkaliphila]GFP23482.1 Fur family transcriptional regulator, peroxide stress response regulator [Candidatus Hakubella thermalkaliphila]GFP29716.1 Fur family transcriptional regulator, peroxide stress response regulator [Candidatus Hakubella thermalkaliphila]GFP37518.1 Fur family transcriptional regulator, peroxide stress response regulator [Candidatus Hakubella thermalkaliphila]GFP39533.1 Fur 
MSSTNDKSDFKGIAHAPRHTTSPENCVIFKGKYRNTPQRQTILKTLRGLTTHPSAAEIYLILKEQFPALSFGTVYRNLRILTDQGKILELKMATRSSRFDGNVEQHYHILCEKCGRIADLQAPSLKDIEKRFQNYTDYSVMGYKVELMGICPQCQEKRSSKKILV